MFQEKPQQLVYVGTATDNARGAAQYGLRIFMDVAIAQRMIQTYGARAEALKVSTDPLNDPAYRYQNLVWILNERALLLEPGAANVVFGDLTLHGTRTK